MQSAGHRDGSILDPLASRNQAGTWWRCSCALKRATSESVRQPESGNVVAYTLPERTLAQSVLQAIRDDELAHVRKIEDGDVMDGTLRPTSPRYSDPWQAAFVFAAIKPGMTRISVDAEDDTFLTVAGPLSSIDGDADVIASDDDSGPGLNPAVTLMIRERGVYIIVLSAYEEVDLRASFSYEISLSVLNREDE